MAEFNSTKVRTRQVFPDQTSGLADRMDFLKKYEALVNDPQYIETTPPDQRQDLQAKIDAAKSSFQDEKNKNEWLEVAQQVGRAGVAFAAANAGKDKRDMSNLDFGKGIDYQGRTQSAFDQYKAEVTGQQDMADRGRRDALDQNTVRGSNFKKQEGYLKEGLDAVKDQERYSQMIDMETKRSTREDAREKERAAREEKRGTDQDKKLELAELNQQEKDLQKQLKASETLKNQLEQEGDLSGKSVKKLEEKYGAIAGQADVDLAQIKGRVDTEARKPGRFYGTNPDPVKARTILSEKSAEVRNLLEGIKARKKELGVIKDASGKATPPAGGKIKVKLKATGQTGTLDEKDFDPEKYEKI